MTDLVTAKQSKRGRGTRIAFTNKKTLKKKAPKVIDR